MIIAGTGHRPDKCPSEQIIRSRVEKALRDAGATHFICGMAAGFDLWAGSTALRMGIPVTAARPWKGHAPRKGDEALYLEVMTNAADVVDVTEYDNFPGNWCYQKRNEWMVDHADRVLAFLNGTRGGTFNCVEYAKKVEKPVRNLYATS